MRSRRFIRLVMMVIAMLLSLPLVAENEPEYAGITVAKATMVNDTMDLLVRDGGNYMKVEPEHLPATFVYIPDCAFGPLPVATLMGDTIPATAVFSGCRMSWVWTVQRPEDGATQLVSIVAHEDASVRVLPLVCLDNNTDTVAEAWDSLAWREKVYTESGDYADTIIAQTGCMSEHNLHLTIHKTLYNNTPVVACESYTYNSTIYTESGEYILDTVALPNGDRQVSMITLTITPDCMVYDTVYFCRGLNTPHEEKIGVGMIRRFVQYVFESPAVWNYMDGVIVRSEEGRTLVDMHRAETNLYAHYVGGLEPVAEVAWSYLPKGAITYQSLTAGAQPQWIESGVVALQIQFVCGHTYRSSFRAGTQDIQTIETEAQPVKRIENGQVVIIRGDAVYTPLGQRIK